MHEIEITDIPPLSVGEEALLEMHGLINVLNVLRCELSILGQNLAGDSRLFADSLALCERMLEAMETPGKALEDAAHIEEYERVILREVEAQFVFALKPRAAGMEESFGNLRPIFTILKLRSRELLARATAPGEWEQPTLDDLRADYVHFLEAVAKNSRGRFRMCFNPALQEASDYYADLRLEAASGPAVMIPVGFRDSIRDLIANARKYTAPGGRITAALHDDTELIRFIVDDTGRGIPKSEVTKVVQYGKRASNVSDVRTHGGGYGLTKAFLITKQFGGRFWIASELGLGTRIRIQIPRPKAT
ncbi:MAG: ATP-binding protein [Opitutaceae bacterium]|nr:ATP-binding protein [Opitutaceae bacterium]